MSGFLKYLLFFLLLIPTGVLQAQEVLVGSPLRFLALGDSYTIGQSVAEDDRWPVQLATKLEALGVEVEELTIIAQTGWRTDNLWNAILTRNPQPTYNLVSLLIGVNNQYQGADFDRYPNEFRQLLEKALALCEGEKERVMVLSIPDYGYTPFGASNREQISGEIDQYNKINKKISEEMGVAWFNITDISRQALEKPGYLAPDQLHPSGVMYALWVELILKSIRIEVPKITAVAEIDPGKTVVFPNPANERLYVQLSENAATIEIYDILGQKIRKVKASNHETREIDVSHWKSGLYFYRIMKEGRTTESGKFLVR